jgi:hypothetical protein
MIPRRHRKFAVCRFAGKPTPDPPVARVTDETLVVRLAIPIGTAREQQRSGDRLKWESFSGGAIGQLLNNCVIFVKSCQTP